MISCVGPVGEKREKIVVLSTGQVLLGFIGFAHPLDPIGHSKTKLIQTLIARTLGLGLKNKLLVI